MDAPSRTVPTLLSLSQLAQRWDVNIKTLYALVERGELPAVRLGRLIKVALAAVETIEAGRIALVGSSSHGRATPAKEH